MRVLTTCSTRFRRIPARKQSLNSDMISTHFNVGDNILAITFPEPSFGFREPRMKKGVLEAKTASCAPQSRFWHRFCARREFQFLESHANLAAILNQRLTYALRRVVYISRAFIRHAANPLQPAERNDYGMAGVYRVNCDDTLRAIRDWI